MPDRMPWVVVAPGGVHWLGHAASEQDAWTVALGWPDKEEIDEAKARGWYAAQATVSWKRPDGVPASQPVQYRHKRTGGVYEMIGTAKLQTDKPLFDMAELVAYRGEDGGVWARAAAEFDDRFERVRAHGEGGNDGR